MAINSIEEHYYRNNLMSSNTITMIFCLGGITFLFNWLFFLNWYFKNNSLQITGKIQQVKIFLTCLLISIFGVLGTGVIFVSALMFSHG